MIWLLPCLRETRNSVVCILISLSPPLFVWGSKCTGQLPVPLQLCRAQADDSSTTLNLNLEYIGQPSRHHTQALHHVQLQLVTGPIRRYQPRRRHDLEGVPVSIRQDLRLQFCLQIVLSGNAKRGDLRRQQ